MNQYRPRTNAIFIQSPVAMLPANGLWADHSTDQPRHAKQTGILPRIVVVAVPTHEGLATAATVIVVDLHFKSDDVVGSQRRYLQPRAAGRVVRVVGIAGKVLFRSNIVPKWPQVLKKTRISQEFPEKTQIA